MLAKQIREEQVQKQVMAAVEKRKKDKQKREKTANKQRTSG